MVFQEANLLPWRNLRQNIEFPFEIKRRKPDEARIAKLLDETGLAGFDKAYPRELSGGMQQRASIVRALAQDPAVLLMDEPFGALDAFTRDEMNLLLLRLWEETRKTIVFVTHNISEAIFLADRVVVMTPRPGRVAQHLRDRPAAAANDRDDLRARLHRAHPGDQARGRVRRPTGGGGRVSDVPTRAPRRDPELRQAGRARARADRLERAHLGAGARSALEIAALVGLFAVVFFVIQGDRRLDGHAGVRLPEADRHRQDVRAGLHEHRDPLAEGHRCIEFLAGLAIGSTVGLLLAALLTQKPFAEKIIAPYILIMVTTPMLAFVPFLRLKMGFGSGR